MSKATEPTPEPVLLLSTAESRAVKTTRNGKEIIVIERLGFAAMQEPRWMEVYSFFPSQAAPWGDPSTLCDLLLRGARPSTATALRRVADFKIKVVSDTDDHVNHDVLKKDVAELVQGARDALGYASVQEAPAT
jgi:hypothetical protein